MPAVPPTAVLQDVQGPYVWVVDKEGRAERRSIARGEMSDDWLFVEKGLRNALRTSRGDIGVLFSSVVCWVLIALCIFGILSPIFMNKLEKNAEKEAAEATGADVEELTEEDSV